MALDRFQINSKLAWDCHQQDPTGMGAGKPWVDGNEIATQLARQASSHPPTGTEPVHGISATVARAVIKGWMSRKHKGY
jgi:hypothetical protein